MDNEAGTAELDARIDALRISLGGADDPGAELLLDLTGALADRYQYRLEAGDPEGARGDLSEAIRRLDDAAARIGQDHPSYPDVALGAGFGYEERWRVTGDAADRDSAIRCLAGAVTVLPPSEPVLPAVHATLVSLLGSRYEDAVPPNLALTDLDAAIEHARTGLALAAGSSTDLETVVGLRELLGCALDYRFTATAGQLRYTAEEPDTAAVAAGRADRDEAVAILDDLLRDLPAGDPAWLDAAAAAGRLHHDRYDDPWPGAAVPDPGDLDTAIDLLTSVVSADEPGYRTVLYLMLALQDRVDMRSDPGDRDALITCRERLLGFPETTDAEAKDLHDLLGLALLDRAEDAGDGAGASRSDLDASIRHLEAVLAVTEPGEDDQAWPLAMLAKACWLRLDGDFTRYDEVDLMTSYARRAWPLLPRDDVTWALTGIYLGTGAYEKTRRPGQPVEIELVSEAIGVLTEVEPMCAADPDLHAVVLVALGAFLAGRGQLTGDAADLLAAQRWVLRASELIPAGYPQWAELNFTLAGTTAVLANYGAGPDFTDRSIELLTEAVRQPGPEPDRAMLLRAGLGAMLIQRATFTSSTRDLDDGIIQMTAAYQLPVTDEASRLMIASSLGTALASRFVARGDEQDRDAASYYSDVVARHLAGSSGDDLRSLAADVDAVVSANRGMLGTIHGAQGDQGALDEAVTEFRRASALLPPGHPHQAQLRSDLGLALTIRAVARGNRPADLEDAVTTLKAAADAMPAGHMARPLVLLRMGGTLAVAGVAGRDARMLREAIRVLTGALDDLDPRFGERVRFIALLGAVAEHLHGLTGEPADLRSAAAWLEEARRQLDGRPGHPQHANSLIMLAHVYHAGGSAAAARESGLAALRLRVRDVLLQTGTARALRYARSAAAESTEVASWCLGDGEPGLAVEALELGRGLVLHSATSVADLPELLSAAGHQDLAQEWLRAGPADSAAPWDGYGAEPIGEMLAGVMTLEVPSDLRARTLEALAGSAVVEKLLAPPVPADLAAALAGTGADALVYLLPPAGDSAGLAVLLPATGLTAGAELKPVPLPLLRGGLGDPVEGYVAAYGAVLAVPPPPAATDPGHQEWQHARELATGRWHRALDALCDWAWPAVMEPLLDRVSDWQLGRPPRLVLVPVGQLSLVPWHAARSRPGSGSGPSRYACAEAVISYAASGRQLIEVSRRPALATQADPVIVGNPTRSLPFATLEAKAIHACCYPAGRYLGHDPAGRYLGEAGPGRAGEASASGTPEEVLAELPAADRPGASVLHLGCHANVVSSAPGRSHLILAGEQELRVDAILRRASGRPPNAPGGLVSLAACRSDLAAAEYDEALTLSTAFLAAGAATVVGARWEVPDEGTSLLMFMFHHFITSGGHAPRDALRLAQLWMLDPDRTAPPEMPQALAKEAKHADNARVIAWAAFTHQGQ